MIKFLHYFRMNLFFSVIFFLFCCAPLFAQQWEEIKAEHFLVFYNKANADFAKEVCRRAEDYYKSIAEDMGYVRYSNFWTWDNRVKIYIYDNHKGYLSATGRQAWSHGVADYGNKQIISYVYGQGFLETLLPHEIAHLVFRDFIGFKSDIPLWLDEGVAQWQERWKRAQLKQKIKENFQKRLILTLPEMMKTDIRQIKINENESEDGKNTEENIYIRSSKTTEQKAGNVMFLSGKRLVNLYYLQAFSLVGFLIERYGADDFVKFCRGLRDGKSLVDSLKYTYPTDIRSMEDLERKWMEYLGEL